MNGQRDFGERPFAALLKQLRAAAGLTQEELAEASGVAVRSISDLERGVNLTARKDTARLLAGAMRLEGQARVAFEAAARGRAAGLGPSSASPAEDAAEVSRTLPPSAASFVGRQGELRVLESATMRPASAPGSTSVWTVGGMAGIGKTAFAIHAGHQLASRYPDGQIFLPLHAHTPGQQPVQPADALASLLQMVGVAVARIPAGIEARAQMWRDEAAGKRLLLVLDDAASHDQVRPLVAGAEASLVLITSRRHLTALEYAREISLVALTEAEGGELFARLAARRDLAGTDADVAEITRLAGQLPLAIGMLARQLHHHPVWTARGLASDLALARDRLQFMRAEDVSVAAAFDLSYRDLTADQQRMFRRLGLHAWTDLDGYAAAALDGIDPGLARQRLDHLYDHYLLTETSPGRFQCHDLLREHARTLADTDPPAEREAAVGRVLAYYIHTARAADRFLARRAPALAYAATAPAHAPPLQDREAAVSWMESERLNLEAAARYAGAHGQPALSAAIAAAMHGFLRSHGHWHQARLLHHAALDAARRVGDQLAEAGALTDLGTFQLITGDSAAAIASHETAVKLHHDLGNRLGEANARSHLGDALRMTGDHPAARASYLAALTLHSELGNRLGEANAHRGLGAVAESVGRYAEAAERYDEALRLFRELGNPTGEARVLNHLGWLAQASASPEQAYARYERALAIASQARSLPEQARAAEGLGVILVSSGDRGAGLRHLRQALRLYQQLGSVSADRVQRLIEVHQQA